MFGRFWVFAFAALLFATPALAQEKGVLLLAQPSVDTVSPKITPFETGIEITAKWPTAVSLGRVHLKDKKMDQSYITYSADLQGVNLSGTAFLEMAVQFKGKGYLFSRALDKPLDKDSGWRSFSTPFVLKEGVQPDEVVLNVRIEGTGTVRVRNVKLAYVRGAAPKTADEKAAAENAAQEEPEEKEEDKEEAKEEPKEEAKK